ncbi:MAG TPA: PAS domain S-box protein [Methanolinea sp.]|nr:PAS domain S-box protein [Methanolinea sp.]HQK56114.1 PAS domain S-box protein [Methanolinea sp.]
MYSVLYVDDEPPLLEVTKLYIERTREFQVSTANSAHEALERLAITPFDAIVSDYQMPGMDGIAFLQTLRSRGDETPFIIFTGKGREEVVIEALNNGADFYLQKGGDPKAQFTELVHKIKRAIQERVSRNLMLEIIQGSPIPKFVIDRDHKVIFWNRALEEYSGIMAEDIVGTMDHWKAFYDHKRPCLADLIVENDQDAIIHWYAGKYQESAIMKGAYQATDLFPGIKGGTWLFFTAAPLHDTNGNIIGAVETLQDITSLRTKEDELRVACEETQKALEQAWQSEEKYRTLVEHANEGIFVAQGDYLKFVNPKMSDISGYSSSELLSHPFAEFVHEEDRDMILSRYLKRIREEDVPSVYEFRIKTKMGSIRWVEIRPVLIMWEGDLATLNFLSDITDRRHMENALKAREQQLNNFMHNLPVGIFRNTPGPTGRRIMANPILAEMHGYDSFEEFMNVPVSDMYADPGERIHISNRLLQDGRLSNVVIHLKKKNGELFWGRISAVAVIGEGGTVEYFDGILEDITEQIRAETALSEAGKKLAILSSITRHDILNKITMLQGYHDLLSRLEQREEGLALLQKEAAIIDAITRQIEFTREYEKLGIEAPRWQRLHDVIVRAVKECDLGNVHLRDETGDIEIYADAMLERVFYNLTENTLRFGGKVTRIRIFTRRAEDGLVIIYEDNGIGIPDNEKEKIFERGYGRHTGLGLFFVREILDITGMTIAENGRMGEGARFEITVPKGGFRYPS